jgi:hypothetical protein
VNVEEIWMTIIKKTAFCFFALIVLATASKAGAGEIDTSVDAGVEPEPIPVEWAEAFGAIRPDQKPDKLTRNSHYWVSDEKRHDLFREAIAGKGGVFIGLGTDQNYLMAGWARPDVLVPLDFDQMVVYLHYAFRVAFLNAKTPAEFVDLWSEENKRKMKRLLKAEYQDPDLQKGVLKAFGAGRRHVYRRLGRARRAYRKLDVPTYLQDPEQYGFIVGMFKANRVFPVRGDLTASNTVKDVAEAVRKTGLRIGAIYLSNAEQYFKYTKDYRENMLALPLDEKSAVIRTIGQRSRWSPDGLYDYIVQNGDNFHAWLKYPKAYTVWTLVNAREVNRQTGGSVIIELPPEEE